MGKNKIDLTEYIKRGEELSFSKRVRLVLMLSIPSIMAQISSIIMQYIDAAMVGRLGADGSAAIGLVSTTCWMFGSLAYALTTGYSVQGCPRNRCREEGKSKMHRRAGSFCGSYVGSFFDVCRNISFGKSAAAAGADPRIHKMLLITSLFMLLFYRLRH